MDHPSHQHPLHLNSPGTPYTCSGCGELGFGSSYRCENRNCNYILHEECANANAASTAFHPFFERSCFEFHERAPGYRTRYCDACGKDVTGFVYHCPRTGYDLHPCCLKLKDSISDEDGRVTLKLCQKVTSKCGKCKRRNVVGRVKGWSYASSGGRTCYHVSCVKELILENWNRGYFSQGTNSTNRDVVPIRRRSSRRLGSTITRIGVVVFKLIFSAIFGDPIGVFASLVEALVSN